MTIKNPVYLSLLPPVLPSPPMARKAPSRQAWRDAMLFAAAMSMLAPSPSHASEAPAATGQNIATPTDMTRLAQRCAGQDGVESWDMAVHPAKIHGRTYYVGTCGIAAILIDSDDGLVLIDAATQKGGPAVAASIRALGFDPANIRLLLTTHEHMDHAGGLALIQKLSGAPMLAMPDAHSALSTGKPDTDDPQHDMLPDMDALRVDGALHDGVPLTFGQIGLTPYSTPVHTKGSTSYVWQSCVGEDDAVAANTPDARNNCVTIAFMDSLSTPAPAGYSFRQKPDQRRRIEAGLAKAAQISCTLLITPHPSASALMERMAGQNALVQEGACAHYVATAKVNFENRLAKEPE